MEQLAYRITGGSWSEHEILEDGLIIVRGTCLPGDLPPQRLLRGQPGPHWDEFRGWFLPWATETVARIAPFCEFWIAPAVEGCDRRTWGGIASRGPAIGSAAYNGWPTHIVAAVYHELQHLIDPYLSQSERVALDVACLSGADWPGEYLDSLVERRARLFEHFAVYMHEGGRVAWTAETQELQVLIAIYDGTVGVRGTRDYPASRLPPPKPGRLRRAWDAVCG